MTVGAWQLRLLEGAKRAPAPYSAVTGTLSRRQSLKGVAGALGLCESSGAGSTGVAQILKQMIAIEPITTMLETPEFILLRPMGGDGAGARQEGRRAAR
ncbi:hypothetical protein BK644_19075 [Pseudomonas protegens]|nr:hypothetical protein BK644_19075 [Pseudomonas protegens]